jgi:hypothetical protein
MLDQLGCALIRNMSLVRATRHHIIILTHLAVDNCERGCTQQQLEPFSCSHFLTPPSINAIWIPGCQGLQRPPSDSLLACSFAVTEGKPSSWSFGMNLWRQEPTPGLGWSKAGGVVKKQLLDVHKEKKIKNGRLLVKSVVSCACVRVRICDCVCVCVTQLQLRDVCVDETACMAVHTYHVRTRGGPYTHALTRRPRVSKQRCSAQW